MVAWEKGTNNFLAMINPIKNPKETILGIGQYYKNMYYSEGFVYTIGTFIPDIIIAAVTGGIAAGAKTGGTAANIASKGMKVEKILPDELVGGAGKTGSLVIETGGKFSASEIRAAEYMKSLGNNVTLRMPQGTRASGGTSDLLVNGVKYDVYTPTTSNPDRIIGAIADKNSQATGIVLDLSQTSVTVQDLGNILSRVKGSVEAGGKTLNITDIVVLPN